VITLLDNLILLLAAGLLTGLRGLGRRALQSAPADIRGARCLVGLRPAAQPEEPLGQQQVDDDGHVDDERQELERREPGDELADLERQQRGRDKERQVFGPTPLTPTTGISAGSKPW